MPVQWSNEAEDALIEHVFGIPFLWNSKHPNYCKKILKKEVYKKISEKLQGAFPDIEGIDADTLINKFNMMKSSFRRELTKMKETEDYTPKWRLFESMSFIANTVTPQGSTSNLNKTAPLLESAEEKKEAMQTGGGLPLPKKGNTSMSVLKSLPSISKELESCENNWDYDALYCTSNSASNESQVADESVIHEDPEETTTPYTRKRKHASTTSTPQETFMKEIINFKRKEHEMDMEIKYLELQIKEAELKLKDKDEKIKDADLKLKEMEIKIKKRSI